MILMIDNYDSFVYNLNAYFEELGAQLRVCRNDALKLSDIRRMNPSGIVISPGPGTPEGAGLSCSIVREFYREIPILGVCLGHQVIGSVFGASVHKGTRPMHGKVTPVRHQGTGLFFGLPQDFRVTRYHSLVVDEGTIPAELQVDARTADGAVMGISHRTYPVYGVQFHPEAVLTEYGHELLENYLEICRERRCIHEAC